MKRFLFVAVAMLTLASFQSCSKCGHCHKEETYGVGGIPTTIKTDEHVVCGNSANESGSDVKAAELDCKAWATRHTTVAGHSYSSSWETDK
jgi:hypothetical protein